MSKTLGIIAAFALAATALLALKNKGAYQNELAKIKTEQQREESTKGELADEKKRVADAEEAKDDYNAKDEVAQGKLEDATEKLAGAQRTVASLEEEFNANEVKIAESSAILESLPNPKELVPKVTSMRTELAALKDDIVVQESRLSSLTTKEDGLKSKVSAVRDVISLQSSGDSYPSMRARISSIYPDLGFVILNAGDKQGVVSGSILDVMRDSEVIGKLKVTAVEAGKSTANIVLDSVQLGNSLQTGDSVVAESKKSIVSFQ